MEENKYRYDLASAVTGATIGATFGVVTGGLVGATVGVGFAVAGVAGVVAGAVAAGAVADTRPRNCVIGGITSLAVYSAMALSSEIGYDRGIETRLTPFSVEQDQGIVVQRGDGSQIPYVLKDGAYVLLDDLSSKELGSKVEESQKTVNNLEGNYQARRNAILESIVTPSEQTKQK